MARLVVGSDDAALARVLAAEIEGAGHLAIVAATGQEVLEYAAQSPPDMVLLTPSLPVFDGFETARQLRDDPSIPPSLPIVLVGAETGFTRTAETAGITTTLPKGHSAADTNNVLAQYLPPETMPPRLPT